jgi:hypothetical protein
MRHANWACRRQPVRRTMHFTGTRILGGFRHLGVGLEEVASAVGIGPKHLW